MPNDLRFLAALMAVDAAHPHVPFEDAIAVTRTAIAAVDRWDAGTVALLLAAAALGPGEAA